MRNIKYIAVHCTATHPTATVESIRRYWLVNLGWKNPGYHYIIDARGYVHHLLPENEVANGVQGYNSVSVHVSYIGGVDISNRPQDTRTKAQKAAMLQLIQQLRTRYPKAIIQGHRDFPNVKKACPSFDAKKEYSNI